MKEKAGYVSRICPFVCPPRVAHGTDCHDGSSASLLVIIKEEPGAELQSWPEHEIISWRPRSEECIPQRCNFKMAFYHCPLFSSTVAVGRPLLPSELCFTQYSSFTIQQGLSEILCSWSMHGQTWGCYRENRTLYLKKTCTRLGPSPFCHGLGRSSWGPASPWRATSS